MRQLTLIAAVSLLAACHLIGGVHDATLSDDGGTAGGGAADGGAGGTGTGISIPTGLPCDSELPCASGHCADGVCCDRACDGPCDICSDPGSGVGTCAPLPAGEPGSCSDSQLCNEAGACVACGESSPATGLDCPGWCDACEDGVCVKLCDQEQECTDELPCPAGWACRIECTAKQACQEAEVLCPLEQACEVVCSGEQACQGTAVVCGGGACSLDCGAGIQVCEDAEVECSWNACTITSCGAGPAPAANCNDSCACAGC